MRKNENDFYWYWFANIPGIGIQSQKKLLNYFGHPSKIYAAKENEFKQLLSTKQRQTLFSSKNEQALLTSAQRLKKQNIHFIHRESKKYPNRLLQIYNPPIALYYIGRFPDFSKPVLAIVGARKATMYGRTMARKFASYLAKRGVQIISGLASGIDSYSHMGALDVSGYTAGVLGGGIDTIYPKENYNLYQRLYAEGGVISEYNIGITNQKGLFPMRNRIISGISDGIFIVEAGEKSGSLITADQGLEQGKDIFALPGRITDRLSFGCNQLINQGAVLVRTPDDIMEVIKKDGNMGNLSSSSCANVENFHILEKNFFEKEEEKKIFALLDEIHPVTFDFLLKNSGLSMLELQHILMKFELKNIIYQIEQNVYLRKV